MSANLSSPGYSFALPAGTMLGGHYRIEAVLGKPGGFGITYLARDQVLNCDVAVKEFLPRGIAARSLDGTTIQVHSAEDDDVFRHGLRRFLTEAEMLARLHHPNIVGVHAFFEANGTAYIIMEYTPGRTLGRYLERIGGRLAPHLAVEIFLRVLDGLHTAHLQHILHRDVKPDNIYLTQDGRPILLDFGAARQAVGEKSQRLTTIMTPGYAPIEQYGDDAGKQGPWTDVYGAAASLYRTLTGQHPPEAMHRLRTDGLVPPAQIVPEIPAALNDAVVRGLAVSAARRPQSAREFQDLLEQATRHQFVHAVPDDFLQPTIRVQTAAQPTVAVRPAEPLTGPTTGHSTGHSTATPRRPFPWRRFFARSIDHTLYFTLLIFFGLVIDQRAYEWLPFAMLLPFWILLEAGLFALMGTTPGKALFGVVVRDAHNAPLGFTVAAARATRVWFFGLGMHIPIVALITMFVAYSKLLEHGVTSWDRALELKVKRSN